MVDQSLGGQGIPCVSVLKAKDSLKPSEIEEVHQKMKVTITLFLSLFLIPLCDINCCLVI